MNRAARRAQGSANGIGRAASLVAQAANDPMAAARTITELENMVRGAYTLMHVLVRRAGGTIEVPRAEQLANPLAERVDVAVDREGDIVLSLQPSDG